MLSGNRQSWAPQSASQYRHGQSGWDVQHRGVAVPPMDSLDALISELDFTSHDRIMEDTKTPSVPIVVPHQAAAMPGRKATSAAKSDFAVDHLDTQVLNPLIQPAIVKESNAFPAKLTTDFKKKYYRFDNKALQCFPNCSRFPDVREARLTGQDHKTGGRNESFCTNQVVVIAMVPNSVALQDIIITGRFLCATPDLDVLPNSDAPVMSVGTAVVRVPEANCTAGMVRGETGNLDVINNRREVALFVNPADNWYFNLTLPRHRRNASCAAHKVPLFVFEVLIFVRHASGSLVLSARTITTPFEIASIRTLIREVLAYRQTNGLKGGDEMDCEDEEDHDSSEALPPAKTVSTVATRRSLAPGYSTVINRVRLAEATKRDEELKKKQVLVVEIVEKPLKRSDSEGMDVIMSSPAQEIARTPSPTSFFPQQSFQPLPFVPMQSQIDIPSFDIPELFDSHTPAPFIHSLSSSSLGLPEPTHFQMLDWSSNTQPIGGDGQYELDFQGLDDNLIP